MVYICLLYSTYGTAQNYKVRPPPPSSLSSSSSSCYDDGGPAKTSTQPVPLTTAGGRESKMGVRTGGILFAATESGKIETTAIPIDIDFERERGGGGAGRRSGRIG